MKDYMLLIVADLLLAGNFAITKLYQNKAGTSVKAGFLFNAIVGLFTAAIFFVINGFSVALTPYSLLMVVLKNVFCIAYIIIGFKILKNQGIAIYTLFLMTGGMVVPYIWGLAFLNEVFSFWRLSGLIFIIGGVAASNFTDEKIKLKYLGLCILIFFLNGGVSVVSKLHSIENTYATVSTNDFLVLGGIMTFVISGIGYFLAKPSEKREVNKGNILVIMAFSALLSGVSYMIQLTGAASLPATVLYPFITGGSMIFSALAGRLFFKEKLTKNIIISLVLCFVGTLLFL